MIMTLAYFIQYGSVALNDMDSDIDVTFDYLLLFFPDLLNIISVQHSILTEGLSITSDFYVIQIRLSKCEI